MDDKRQSEPAIPALEIVLSERLKNIDADESKKSDGQLLN